MLWYARFIRTAPRPSVASMTQTQARSWAYAAVAAGVIANALFIAFYASFAVQHFAGPRGVAAILGSAADYAGIPQNALLAVITGVVFRFLAGSSDPTRSCASPARWRSRRQRPTAS